MTGSQYKNIIDWSLHMNVNVDVDNLHIVKRIFDNLGVSFPNGNNKEVFLSIKENTFLGWRPIRVGEAQRYANAGFATMAIDEERIVLIRPDDQINNLSDNEKICNIQNQNVLQMDQIPEKERETLLFYAYRYGFSFEKEQKKG